MLLQEEWMDGQLTWLPYVGRSTCIHYLVSIVEIPIFVDPNLKATLDEAIKTNEEALQELYVP